MAGTTASTLLKRSLSVGAFLIFWAFVSTGVGVAAACVNNYCGHGSVLYGFLAWLAGGMGFAIQIVLMATVWVGGEKASILDARSRTKTICLTWIVGATIVGIVAALVPVLLWGPVGDELFSISSPMALGIGALGLLAHLAFRFSRAKTPSEE